MATVKRARGGNNLNGQQEAYRRQLAAPVFSWKKDWVRPESAPEGSSFKVSKWVRTGQKVDLKRNLATGTADEAEPELEAEDLDDPGENDDAEEDEDDEDAPANKEDKMDVDEEADAQPKAIAESKGSGEDGLTEQSMPAGLPAPGQPVMSEGAIPSADGPNVARSVESTQDDSPMIVVEGTDSPARAPGMPRTADTPSKLSIPPSKVDGLGSPRRRSKSPSPVPSPSRMTRSRSRTPTPDPERLAHLAEAGGMDIPPPDIPMVEMAPSDIGNLPSPGLDEGKQIGDSSTSEPRLQGNTVEVKVVSGLAAEVNTQFGEVLSVEAIEARQLAGVSKPMDPNAFALGTRASQLALIQTNIVAASLSSLHPSSGFSFPVVPMSVAGDRNKTSPLYLLSTSTSTVTPAKSLWTEELEDALMAGYIDAIVHSCKDVPTVLPERCELGAMLKREDPHDALVVKEGLPYKTLRDLPEGSVVGTSSVRRIAQLRRYYPSLKVMDVRGNLDTRFRKLDDPAGPYTAIILAAAGIERMSLSHRTTCLLKAPEMYHAVSQGAIAIEIRSGDARVKEMLKGAGDWETEWRIGVERGLLRELEGGCSVPVGVETVLIEVSQAESAALKSPFDSEPKVPVDGDPLLHHSGFGRAASLHVKACVTSLDGTQQVEHDAGPVLIKSWKQAEDWGHIIARILIDSGANKILDEINAIRQEREQQDLARAAQDLAAAPEAPQAEGAPAMQFTDLGAIAHAKAKEEAVKEVEMEGTTDAAAVLGEGDPVGAGGEKDLADEDFDDEMAVDQ